jgi:uncharacterized protein
MDPVDKTRAWLQDFVLALNLCPFAHAPFSAGAVRIVQSRAADEVEVLAEVVDEAHLLVAEPVPETTLLVVPTLLANFDDLLDLVAAAEALLERIDLDQDIQLVGFHPDYQFDGAPADDPANATNRSPLPIVHLLRRKDVARAAASHPDVDGIAERNITLLRQMATDD